MLREELRNMNIPHHTTIRARTLQVWEEHIEELSKEFEKSVGKISFTMDMWSDLNLSSFMAFTAHWIQAVPKEGSEGKDFILELQADLVEFHYVPGHHTGKHLAKAFMHILEQLFIVHKVI
ncbi:hypothetical protein HWV62_12659 [Athelia sp. TMB]|nr:hypothetical protein HWV62_12659 [Athelia sp. TMB]